MTKEVWTDFISMETLNFKPKVDAWKGFKPIKKGSYGGGLGHCDKCDNPRMTDVHCVKGLKHYCDKHIGGE